MTIEKMIEKIQDAAFSPEELGKLAGAILNETDLSRETWINFWSELNENCQGELESRIGEASFKDEDQ